MEEEELPVIEKGVPIPWRKKQRTDPRIHTLLEQCLVGDSFLWPVNSIEVYWASESHGKAYGRKYHSQPEGTSRRVWRIA